MRKLLRQIEPLVWGTGDGWAVVRNRGISHFMFSGAIGFNLWMAIFVHTINAVLRMGAFSPFVAAPWLLARIVVDVVIMFCLGLGVARMMWWRFDRTSVHDEIRRSVSTRPAA